MCGVGVVYRNKTLWDELFMEMINLRASLSNKVLCFRNDCFGLRLWWSSLAYRRHKLTWGFSQKSFPLPAAPQVDHLDNGRCAASACHTTLSQ